MIGSLDRTILFKHFRFPSQSNLTGSMFHMSLAYSRIVLSLLNLYEPAVFKIDILVHLCFITNQRCVRQQLTRKRKIQKIK